MLKTIKNDEIEYLAKKIGLGENKKPNHEVLLERFSNSITNIEKLVSDELFSEIFAIIDSKYVVFFYKMKEERKTHYDFQIYIKDLHTKNFNTVAHSDVKICPKKMKIEWIETEHKYKRIGFAGLILKCAEYYCANKGIKKICGDIHQNTPIGVENLVSFYEKCGYSVTTDKKQFKKYL